MHKSARWGMISLVVGTFVAVAATGCHVASRVETQPVETQPVETQPKYVQEGEASWYGPGFQGRKTASGETFDQNDLTAAHRKLPLGSEATITNLENGKQVDVKINDRGPYAQGRKIDLSKAAARKLDILGDGTAPVRIEATEEQLQGTSGSNTEAAPVAEPR